MPVMIIIIKKKKSWRSAFLPKGHFRCGIIFLYKKQLFLFKDTPVRLIFHIHTHERP